MALFSFMGFQQKKLSLSTPFFLVFFLQILKKICKNVYYELHFEVLNEVNPLGKDFAVTSSEHTIHHCFSDCRSKEIIAGDNTV